MIDPEALFRDEARDWLNANREFAASELRRAALEGARCLTLPEAAKYLSLVNVRQVVDFCRANGIRISGSHKKRFVMRSEIDAYMQRTARLPSALGDGTAVARVLELQEEAA